MSAAASRPTVENARRALAARFKAAGIESPELDARLLVGAVLALDLGGLIAAAGKLLSPEQVLRLDESARRRLDGEPVARILGQKEFWGLRLQLSAATLVPRPDTETVVELAIEMLRGRAPREAPLRIADIGTGSGAILLALLSEWPDAFGIGTDISVPALRTARANAGRLGLGSRAAFVACDHAAALSGQFDLIVSNPPYIRSADIAGLAAEVRNHDPLRALDGGADGLNAYRALLPQAADRLAPGATLIVEIGHDQCAQVEAMMTAAGLMLSAPAKRDLAGIYRAVAGSKKP